MTLSPLAYAESLRIGTVEFVSPDEIKVQLDLDAPDAVALNSGTPRPFPRVNGYVLIPSEQGLLVAQVEWITVERSQYPKRKGMQDFGLVDLPYPLRKISLNPLGSLVVEGRDANGAERFRFRRGVEAYPTVGDPVLLPTALQLRDIVESGDHRRVKIGISPLAGNADVRVDPDRLFGRHLAVLGNTGSGKSCSVAGLIRWSLDAARAECNQDAAPNARFIVLDPNGEYAKAFGKLGAVRIFAVEAGDAAMQLQVPLWFWNSAEWSAFTQASSKTQRPTLTQALRAVRDAASERAPTPSHDMRRFLRTLVSAVHIEKNAGNPWKGAGPARGFRDRLKRWQESLVDNAGFSAAETESLNELRQHVDQLLNAHTGDWPQIFTRQEVNILLEKLSETHSAFGGSDTDVLPIDADVPRPFTGDQLVRSVEANAEVMNVSEYVETMLMRIRTLLSDSRMKVIAGGSNALALDAWLTDYIGGDGAANGTITVIDLSLVPAEVVHLVAAVTARMTLEALQRYRRLNQGKVLPTVLVMEEAHTFIKRYNEDSEYPSSAAICCQVFERIAREGRKFGLGLVLSSQRPSELSPTALSQCNTFLLHRISNDRDQELVHRLVPDNLRGLLRDLPSLPARQAILLGWASELPVLVQMNHLPAEHRPKSDDPDFWSVWTGAARAVNWKVIADDWQQVGPNASEQEGQR